MKNILARILKLFRKSPVPQPKVIMPTLAENIAVAEQTVSDLEARVAKVKERIDAANTALAAAVASAVNVGVSVNPPPAQ